VSIALAATWNPRGELPRLKALLPDFLALYASVAIVLPTELDEPTWDSLQRLADGTGGQLAIHRALDWRDGRRESLAQAVQSAASSIQYADLDRLLRWLETNPQELLQAAQEISRWDYLLIERQPAAYATHPQALIQTEAISNLVGSYFLGQKVDLSAGSKGFSRKAAEFLLAQAPCGRPFGADAAWAILLKRAGFRIGTLAVAGLDWETADRYQEQAAASEQQQAAAAAYDADPAHWAHRLDVAQEIVQAAIDAARQPLPVPELGDFDFDAVFYVDDYMYFYSDMLLPEVTDRQAEALVRLLEMQPQMKILDLACGFGRHANRLALMGYDVTGIDLTPGFLEIARRDAAEMGVQVDYHQGDMRQLDFEAQFDRALLLFTAFGYFDDQGNLEVLRRIARALKPGGRLVFDSINRDSFLKRMLPFIVTEKDGNLMIDRSSFDCETGRTTNRRIVLRDGLRRDKPFSVRLYNPNELRTLLPLAGLEPTGFYGDWDGTPLTSESRRMIVIAKKSLPGEEE